jgi:hypothetical protein
VTKGAVSTGPAGGGRLGGGDDVYDRGHPDYEACITAQAESHCIAFLARAATGEEDCDRYEYAAQQGPEHDAKNEDCS